MIYRKSLGDRIFDTANAIVLLMLVMITMYPFLYVLFASLSDYTELISHTGLLLRPLGFTLEPYQAVLKNPEIVTGYKNTFFIVVVGTAYNIFMTSLGAYVLSRKNFMWNRLLSFIIIFAMFFDGGLIPRYLLVQKLGMINSMSAVIIPTAISTWNLFIMRTYFKTIPDSLEESAKLDGASDVRILYRIILPLSLPIIAVMVLYYGVAHWNSWFSAMIYLRDSKKFPLQLILREILIISQTAEMTSSVNVSDTQAASETIKHATVMVATLPILFAYPFLQKYFVKGVMIGALKE